jgi:hypothetical protein
VLSTVLSAEPEPVVASADVSPPLAVVSPALAVVSTPSMVASAMRMPSTSPVSAAPDPLATSTSLVVDPSCPEFCDHVPRSMINESWHDVQRSGSAARNDEFVARGSQGGDDAVKGIDSLRLVATAVME